ncbi:Fe-S cluster assembly protein HesB [Nocardioides sp. MH1]|uniref:Fe-S cluster assembly protein HesB n=1 Tax=Nocardioides sp. MH1 TaxID=3242490 RepID=UPI003521455E
MLTLTENACDIVKRYAEHPDTPDEAGLRISTTPGDQLTVSTADQPVAGDQVVDQGGAKVFLDQSAAEQLDAMMLDASLDEAGNVQFGILAQA